MGRFPPYKQSHAIALIGTLLSIMVLIITLYCVWYPYLVTATFISATCQPTMVIFTGPIQCSSSGSSGTACTPLPTPTGTTIVWNETYTTTPLATGSPASGSTTTASASNTPSISTTAFSQSLSMSSTAASSGASSMVKSRTGNESSITIPQWLSSLTPPTTPFCPSSPCYLVRVLFTTVYGFSGTATLYYNYDQMSDNNYRCSYTSCSSSNNTVNAQTVAEWLRSLNKQFQCYANKTSYSYYRPYMALQQVNFSYAAAANSIFWPILSLIIFGCFLISIRAVAYYKHCNQSSISSTGAGVPDAVNYSASEGTRSVPSDGSFPPGYYAATNAASIDLELPGMSASTAADEKSPAAFAAMTTDGAGGPTYPTPWVAHPPQYGEVAAGRAEAAATWSWNAGFETGSDGTTSTNDGNDLKY